MRAAEAGAEAGGRGSEARIPDPAPDPRSPLPDLRSPRPGPAGPPSLAGAYRAWAKAGAADFRALLGRVPGLWALDKPGGTGPPDGRSAVPGPTSHDIVDLARAAFGLRRIGHAGTLDPLASGLLLLAVGRATKILQYLAGCDKSYTATLLLGRRTDSYDITGAVLEEREVRLTPEALAAALADFRGTIRQVPPPFSALKRGGVPLYRLARQGRAPKLEPREVTISRLELAAFAPPLVRLELDCSKGTYVRSLAEDLGRLLGCGATLAALRRTRVGPFTLADAITPEELLRRAAARELPRAEE